MEEKKQSHYYIYQGKRYENQLGCCVENDLGRIQFRKAVKRGIIKKITIEPKPQWNGEDGKAENK